jgi:hypothetical protein
MMRARQFQPTAPASQLPLFQRGCPLKRGARRRNAPVNRRNCGGVDQTQSREEKFGARNLSGAAVASLTSDSLRHIKVNPRVRRRGIGDRPLEQPKVVFTPYPGLKAVRQLAIFQRL